MSIKKYLVLEGTMTLKSGLHIGGNTDETKVGGCDNPIIKNKLTGEPYIPGSSLKGVMRSIEESRPANKAKVSNGKPCGCGDGTCMICKLFGAHMNTRTKAGLPRLVVCDMYLNSDFKEQVCLEYGETMMSLIDTKTSTMIDINTNAAANGSLRNMEIVSAGTVFDCKFIIKVLDTDDESQLLKEVKFILNRIELQGLGSKTTSGCGQVQFNIDFDDCKEYKM